jgi:putative membrane protein
MSGHWYDLVRGLHILAVIAWMAGLLYLPRLFAYHTRAAPGSQMDETFAIMERKLLRIIMNPAMVVSWILGLALIWIRSHISYGSGTWAPVGIMLTKPWMLTKLGGVLFLTGWHHYLGVSRKRFEQHANTRSEKYWRMVNELPFLAAIIMVLAVTTEFGD